MGRSGRRVLTVVFVERRIEFGSSSPVRQLVKSDDSAIRYRRSRGARALLRATEGEPEVLARVLAE